MGRGQEDQEPNDLQRGPSVNCRPRSGAQCRKGEVLVRPSEVFEITGSAPHGHVAVVLALLRKLKLDRVLHSRPSREHSLCIAMIAMRLLEPGSKLATARSLSAASADTTWDSLLDLGEVSAEDLYAALDWLQRRQPHIERTLAKRHVQDRTLVLYAMVL